MYMWSCILNFSKYLSHRIPEPKVSRFCRLVKCKQKLLNFLKKSYKILLPHFVLNLPHLFWHRGSTKSTEVCIRRSLVQKYQLQAEVVSVTYGN